VTPAEILDFVQRVGETLPGGIGFVCVKDEAGVSSLMLLPTEPPLGPGHIFFMAAPVTNGEVRLAVLVSETSGEERLWEMVQLACSTLERRARQIAARWN
jgi:hypothetical protein